MSGAERDVLKTGSQHLPINATSGIELIPTEIEGIARVKVSDQSCIETLSWDRYVRLKAVADVIKNCTSTESSILDAGGFDGALAFFLPEHRVDLLDPASTGASLLHEPAQSNSYDLVASVDVIEHIDPQDRTQALQELTRIARKFIVLNYPHQSTKAAQELVFSLTNNKLIKEHVEWELPDTAELLRFMASKGFKGKSFSHVSLAVWLGQYLTLNLAPAAAAQLNRYLIQHHSDEPFSAPLYELLVCERTNDYSELNSQ